MHFAEMHACTLSTSIHTFVLVHIRYVLFIIHQTTMPITINYRAGKDTPLEDECIEWTLETETQSFHVAFRCSRNLYKASRDRSIIMHLFRAQESRHLDVYHEPDEGDAYEAVTLALDKEHATVSAMCGDVRVGMHDPELAASLWEDLDASIVSLRGAVTREVARLESQRDAYLENMAKIEAAGRSSACYQKELESMNEAIAFWKDVDASPEPVVPFTRAEIADGKPPDASGSAELATAAGDEAS